MVERNADELTWLKYDLDAIEQCEPTIVARNSDSMVFSGKFDPWGYIAMAVPPGLLRKPGLLRVRVRVNIRKGTVGLGVLTPDERDFYKQTKVTAPGAHVIALETDCSSGPGPIVLRHGQAAAGETEFELELLELQVPATEASPPCLRPDMHPIFAKFPRWSGVIPQGRTVNWLGTTTDLEFRGEPRSGSEVRSARPPLPSFLEDEYFEWIDLMEAVAEARDSFTMVELGAGWGRWLVDAWSALRLINKPGFPVKLIGVEAEPQHFLWMQQHFRNNGLDPNRHRLIEAAIMAKDGTVAFTVGDASKWYGQTAFNIDDRQNWRHADYPNAFIRNVAAVSLATVLDGIRFVDLIDMDIQGSEAEVVLASRDLLQTRVRRVHIGTHGEDIEDSLRQAFRSMGWTCRWDFSLQGHRETPYGKVLFGDGVQGWINPRFR